MLKVLENPINDMFIRLRNEIEKDIERRKKKRIFEKDEELGLKPDTVLDIVRRLENVDLFGIDEDLNGRLFETFLNATMRGRELGQFFTPRSVVKMMTQIADLQATRDRQDKVIDGCCGSGGFLIETLTVMRNKIRENRSLSTAQKENLIDQVVNNCIYGVDYGQDPPLARIARINMYLHGDGGSKIYYADALDKEINSNAWTDAEVVQNMEELRSQLFSEQFDVVLTNPPFSMTKECKNPSEHRVLKQYTLARKNQSSSALRPSLRSSIMFLERYFDMLQPGGRLITVIDETLLSSNDFGYVRNFIRSNFIIRAIISLPGDTFKRSGSRVKTSVLVLEKRRSHDDTQPDWFYFFAEHLGIDELNSKASDVDVKEARRNAEAETGHIVAEYKRYLNGDFTENVLGPELLGNRLDLRNVVPMFGRMEKNWKNQGIAVRRLDEIVDLANCLIKPSDFPEKPFNLLKVSYDGKCEIESTKNGSHVRAETMYKVVEGQLVFSKIRATDGAVSVVSTGTIRGFSIDNELYGVQLWRRLRHRISLVGFTIL